MMGAALLNECKQQVTNAWGYWRGGMGDCIANTPV